MARWKPPDRVGEKELVARRIFGDAIFRGVLDQSQPGRLRLNHFEETRSDRHLSLDRLGRGTAEKRVLRYLEPRCDLAGTRFNSPKLFEGWVGLKVERIRNAKQLLLDVIASPVESVGTDSNDENLYHAHVEIPEGSDYFVALHLKELCERHGIFVYSPNKSADLGANPLQRVPPQFLRVMGVFRRWRGKYK